MYPIEFIVWYSGMDEDKINKSYARWKKERSPKEEFAETEIILAPKLTSEQLEEFNARVREYLITYNQSRAGQAMFNVLEEMVPDLANELRGSQFDPFYQNKRIAAFLDYCVANEAKQFIRPEFKL